MKDRKKIDWYSLRDRKRVNWYLKGIGQFGFRAWLLGILLRILYTFHLIGEEDVKAGVDAIISGYMIREAKRKGLKVSYVELGRKDD